MSSLLPIRSDPSPGGQDPRVVDLDGEDADQVFSALSSATARRIVTVLHEEPRTQSDIAEAIDTSVQNVRYHLDKLEAAGLVEVVDTWYSSRGNEMAVYAPADGALIVSGDEGRASRLKAALSRMIGGTAVIGMASLLVQALARRFGAPGSGGATGGTAAGEEPLAPSGANATDGGSRQYVDRAGGADQSATDTPADTLTGGTDGPATTAGEEAPTVSGTSTPEPTATSTPTDTAARGGENTTAITDGGFETATTAADAVNDTATTAVDAAAAGGSAGLPPGAAFFLGGVTVLAALVAVWYWSGR